MKFKETIKLYQNEIDKIHSKIKFYTQNNQSNIINHAHHHNLSPKSIKTFPQYINYNGQIYIKTPQKKQKNLNTKRTVNIKILNNQRQKSFVKSEQNEKQEEKNLPFLQSSGTSRINQNAMQLKKRYINNLKKQIQINKKNKSRQYSERLMQELVIINSNQFNNKFGNAHVKYLEKYFLESSVQKNQKQLLEFVENDRYLKNPKSKRLKLLYQQLQQQSKNIKGIEKYPHINNMSKQLSIQIIPETHIIKQTNQQQQIPTMTNNTNLLLKQSIKHKYMRNLNKKNMAKKNYNQQDLKYIRQNLRLLKSKQMIKQSNKSIVQQQSLNQSSFKFSRRYTNHSQQFNKTKKNIKDYLRQSIILKNNPEKQNQQQNQCD